MTFHRPEIISRRRKTAAGQRKIIFRCPRETSRRPAIPSRYRQPTLQGQESIPSAQKTIFCQRKCCAGQPKMDAGNPRQPACRYGLTKPADIPEESAAALPHRLGKFVNSQPGNRVQPALSARARNGSRLSLPSKTLKALPSPCPHPPTPPSSPAIKT